MNDFEGLHLLFGVSGGIAAYKAAALTSTLVQGGASVDVVMTAEAERFITPLTFSSLTARCVYTSLWDAPEEIPHIRLVREAHVALVAPATANLIAKLAHGIADDLLTTALLAARIPVLLAPAMNDAMYRAQQTQTNLRALQQRGYTIIEPDYGYLAEREHGTGRLAAESTILQAVATAARRSRSLSAMRVVITAGPTREAFDPVRYISNAATGATGIALAREAALRGAAVTLLLGPTHLEPPSGVNVVRFQDARELHAVALKHAEQADLFIASAAVSDWRPEQHYDEKVKKTEDDLRVTMVRNPDVLAEIGVRKRSTFLVGFAAETQEHEAHARQKLARKHLDAIAVNDVGGNRGFGEQPNRLVLLWGADGRRDLGEARKDVLAGRFLDCVKELIDADRD